MVRNCSRPGGPCKGVQVIEDSVKLIKAMHARQIFVAITQVIFAKLRRGITQRLEQLRDSEVSRIDSLLGSRQPNLAIARAEY